MRYPIPDTSKPKAEGRQPSSGTLKQKTVIIILGPTAVGKTSLAIRIANHFNTEIISADSRQCYREMNIGVAKPSPGQLEMVKHHFINSHSIHEEANAATFELYALKAVEDIFTRKDVVVMVGGTGLYIRAFAEGMDKIPSIEPEIRENITAQYERFGIEWLKEQIKAKDPLFYNEGEIENPQRLMRALEVKLSTGHSIRNLQSGKKKDRDFNILKFGLQIPKETLHENIHSRVEQMMLDGLLDEVRSLLLFRHLKALKTVGYNELFTYLDGHISLDIAIDEIRKNTRHYAKRQMTWFRKESGVIWMSPSEDELITNLL